MAIPPRESATAQRRIADATAVEVIIGDVTEPFLEEDPMSRSLRIGICIGRAHLHHWSGHNSDWRAGNSCGADFPGVWNYRASESHGGGFSPADSPDRA